MQVLETTRTRPGLSSAFETVRKIFFQRWDKTRRWKCQSLKWRGDSLFCGDGLCCEKRKTIYVRPKVENLPATLIHEICHALTPRVNHGDAWQKRMLKAALKAKQIGDQSLAEWLRSEVKEYRKNAQKVTAKSIYLEIEEAVESSPDIPTFDSIVRVLARNYLMTPREFLARFPGSEKAYKRAVRFRKIVELAS